MRYRAFCPEPPEMSPAETAAASQPFYFGRASQTGGGSAESPLFRHEFDGGDMLQSIEHNGAVCFCAYGTATNTHRPIDSVEYVCVCV